MLKLEETLVGRRNFERAAQVFPVAFDQDYPQSRNRPLEAAIIGTGNQGRVLLENADPEHITFKAMCDLRPDHRLLGEAVIKERYNPDVRVYSDVEKMLSDGGFEAVLVATPLHTHAALTLKCLAAGKHVLCEKTMAYTVEECDEMIHAAEKGGLILAIGHQRHANPLYLQAQGWIEQGVIGDVYHIRSLWHRNNEWRNQPDWQSEILREAWGQKPLDWLRKKKLPGLKPEDFEKMKIVERNEHFFELMKEKDPEFDCSKYGYETPDQMANWRLYSKFSHGLMSELGSHQIDAANWLWKSAPEAVCGAGGLYHYKDTRDIFDHVFVTFRYPNNRTLMFTSISTNDFDNYYDQIMGTLGTVYLTGEAEGMLFKEGELTTTEVIIGEDKKSGKPVLMTGPSNLKPKGGLPPVDGTERFRAYGIEITKFAEAVRASDPTLVGCNGHDGRKAAIAVFAANEAIRSNSTQPCNPPEVIAAGPRVRQ